MLELIEITLPTISGTPVPSSMLTGPALFVALFLGIPAGAVIGVKLADRSGSANDIFDGLVGAAFGFGFTLVFATMAMGGPTLVPGTPLPDTSLAGWSNAVEAGYGVSLLEAPKWTGYQESAKFTASYRDCQGVVKVADVRQLGGQDSGRYVFLRDGVELSRCGA